MQAQPLRPFIDAYQRQDFTALPRDQASGSALETSHPATIHAQVSALNVIAQLRAMPEVGAHAELRTP
jgi:hypothetical protein